MKDFSDSLFWLDESRVVNISYNTTEPSVGLALNRDNAKLKLYMADTGLLVSMAFDSGEMEMSGIYEKILHGKLEFNKGMLIENLVAQLLRSSGHPLFFYTRSSVTDSADRMEIDFLIRKKNITSRHNICPVEVKSSPRYTLTSLEKFKNKYSNHAGAPIVIHPKDLELKNGITYIPLYMTGVL